MGTIKVVLDPGHGQYGNPYPTAEGFYEGTQMYKLALMLRKKLETAGIDVVLTRNQVSDDPTLANRGKLAGSTRADLFISLHSDAIGNYVSTSARGVSVYYSIQDAEPNKKFATNLSAAVAELMGTRNRGPMTRIGNGGLDYYGVIRNSAAAGCKRAFLIEHGFHSNPTDVKWLIDDTKLAKIADVDAKIICDWFNVTYVSSSIGNEVIVVPSTEITETEKYTVYTEIPKFISADNAKSGDGSLAVGKLAAGTYYIYKKYNGMYNLTKTVGTAGAWINPNDNKKPEADTPVDDDGDGILEVNEKYEVFKYIKKYSTADDASKMINNKGEAEPGTYYVYAISNGMYNLTKKRGTAGFWANLEQNIYTGFAVYDATGKQYVLEKNDVVKFRSGFTPYYGNNGTVIPTSVIASVNSKGVTKVIDLIKRDIGKSEIQFEAKLDTINSWVPINYLELFQKPAKVETPKDEDEVLDEDIIEDGEVLEEELVDEEIIEEDDGMDRVREVLGDPKYEGIRSAIKSGILSQFLADVIEILSEDDEVIETPEASELIRGNTLATEAQMVKFIQKHNPDFDPAIARAFVEISAIYGIRGDVAICQSIVETGWFKFEGGTAVKPNQHNYCGLGVTSLGISGNAFITIENGVEAQMQHLYAYACKDNIPAGRTLYDPRFKFVTRGCAPRWIDLDGKWCTGTGYGEKILNLWTQLMETK